ncbi:hypothetical protein [Ketobacter alkanivorans]|uniref:Uncharacterized protein n=1 Tax=Ketobacter alkanivorans TaxID=1917421 RepID=A0A2K9LLD1_9GAMM|nr:hypothetical protein [Ketobacter alkanivorans]AUM13037.1 hypothetical protein Kalk_11655 [Ketobacter alkanivorans]
MSNNGTRYDKIIKYLKNHTLFSALLFFGVVLISMSTLLNSAKNVINMIPVDEDHFIFDNTAWNLCINCYGNKAKKGNETGILFYDNGYFSHVLSGVDQSYVERDGRLYKCALSVFDVHKIEVVYSDSDDPNDVGEGCVYLKYERDYCYTGMLGSGDGPNNFAGRWEVKNNKLILTVYENEKEILDIHEIDLSGYSSTEIEGKAYSKKLGYDHVYMSRVPKVSSVELPTGCKIDSTTEAILRRD